MTTGSNRGSIAVMLVTLLFSAPAFAQWVEFTNETGARLTATASLGSSDNQEKDYAYADLDLDGDVDLICVRKQPFTSSGRQPNVLFMNEGGVLVDRTTEFASDSDVAGDQGFLTPTNDRDVIIGDFDGDTWPDFVTVPTLSDGAQKHISHPRIYMNLGESGGVWQGFRYEDARIPALAGLTGGVPHSPRFCSADTADIDGDGDLDIYMGDYDSGPSQTLDFNDRLLINDGNGFFSDETTTRFVNTIIVSGSQYPFTQSAFGTSVAMEDFNGDGFIDIAKDTALNTPQYVGITYNNGAAGTNQRYDSHDVVYQIAPYFIEAGDLNNDGRMDLLTMDDGQDRYLINTGNDGSGQAQFNQLSFSYSDGTGDPGFPGNTRIADMNNDGFLDVFHCDVDVDISGCGRRSKLYRNLGNTPNVTLQSQTGTAPFTPTGVHDCAIFDLNGDGWNDLIIGRCNGTEIWMNEPPGGLVFNFPQGLAPANMECGADYTFQVEVTSFGGVVPQPGAFNFYLSTNDGAYSAQPFGSLGSNTYEVTLPAADLATAYRFYFEATASAGGGTFLDPSGGASAPYLTVVADELITDVNDFEAGSSGWTVETGTGLTSGAWELAEPNGTTDGANPAAPSTDATQAATAVFAFVTENGPVGGTAGANDIDGGFNHLISPTFDFDGTDGQIRFAAWYYNNDFGDPTADELRVAISNNGGSTWTEAYVIDTNTDGWENHSFQVSEVITPTANMRVRFEANDDPNNSLAEAGIDNFTIVRFACSSSGPQFVRGDANADGLSDISDPISLLGYVFGGGAAPTCLKAADANDDGGVNIADAVAMLNTLFSGGGDPPAPFPGCGEDPTDDSLTCEEFAGCP